MTVVPKLTVWKAREMVTAGVGVGELEHGLVIVQLSVFKIVLMVGMYELRTAHSALLLAQDCQRASVS